MRCNAPSVERVARAICEQAFYERHNCAATPQVIDRNWHGFAQQAAAAIEAISDEDDAIAARRAAHRNWERLIFTV